jgi:hypothetical protein
MFVIFLCYFEIHCICVEVPNLKSMGDPHGAQKTPKPECISVG